ncbi:transposase [Streptomyces sp. NBC_00481]|nr:transposase [Streptomyces sp. NBC_00481]
MVARAAGLRVDGTTMAVPDSPANLAEFTKHRCNNGGLGYPALRLLVLVSCGTRTVIDAVFGPTADGETTYAPRLLRSLREGMIVLLDRNFAAQTLVTAMAKTGAHVLVRVKSGRRLPVATAVTAPTCRRSVPSPCESSTARSPSPRPQAAAPASTGSPPP